MERCLFETRKSQCQECNITMNKVWLYKDRLLPCQILLRKFSIFSNSFCIITPILQDIFTLFSGCFYKILPACHSYLLLRCESKAYIWGIMFEYLNFITIKNTFVFTYLHYNYFLFNWKCFVIGNMSIYTIFQCQECNTMPIRCVKFIFDGSLPCQIL